MEMKPIGTVHHVAKEVPRHWTLSEIEGELIIDERYLDGLRDIRSKQRIVVLFEFHQSPPFTPTHLRQKPPHRDRKLGVFSICSPIRPNPIGLSIVEVLEVHHNVVRVKGLDMLDGTPILDIKPHIEGRENCPSYAGEKENAGHRRPADSNKAACTNREEKA